MLVSTVINTYVPLNTCVKHLSSILTTRTGKKVSPWGSHRFLSLKPWRNKRSPLQGKVTSSILIQLSHILALNSSFPWRVSYTSSIILPVAPSWAGFTDFPIGSYVSLPFLLPVSTSRSASQQHALYSEDGGSKVLWNVGNLTLCYTATATWLQLV